MNEKVVECCFCGEKKTVVNEYGEDFFHVMFTDGRVAFMCPRCSEPVRRVDRTEVVGYVGYRAE